MTICDHVFTRDELKKLAESGFGDMVKGVVDIRRNMLALDADLHADLETLLLENGSDQKDLWGINLYPDEEETEDFLEYSSLINIRPDDGNRTMDVKDIVLQERIAEVVEKWTKM